MNPQKVTYLKIEKGVVWASGMIKFESCWPQECKEPEPKKHFLGSRYVCACRFEEDKFNQSFVEVSNPEIIRLDLFHLGIKNTTHNGIYPIEGFVMEVNECCELFLHQGVNIAVARVEDGCTVCHGNCDNRKKVCTLSLAPVVGEAPQNYESMTDIFSMLKGFDWRLENDDHGTLYLSIIDRGKYPRIWIDNAVDNEPIIIAETVEHLLERNNPLLEKDWRVRIKSDTIEGLQNEFKKYLKTIS